MELADKLNDIRAARFATIIAAFGLCLLVYVYTESLFGRPSALLAQLLFVISPNIIAHSSLATTDLYAALATVLFLYTLRRFVLHSTLVNAVVAGCTLALAQLTKFVAAYLYLVTLLFIVFAALYSKYRCDKGFRFTTRETGMLLVSHIVGFVVIVNAGFLFDRTFTPLAKYEFRSQIFARLQQCPLLRAIPLPLPYPYLQVSTG